MSIAVRFLEKGDLMFVALLPKTFSVAQNLPLNSSFPLVVLFKLFDCLLMYTLVDFNVLEKVQTRLLFFCFLQKTATVIETHFEVLGSCCCESCPLLISGWLIGRMVMVVGLVSLSPISPASRSHHTICDMISIITVISHDLSHELLNSEL